MPASNNSQSRRVPRIAFLLSLAAVVIPICYMMIMIATQPYHRGPLYIEVRIIILILGVSSVTLGIIALVKRTRLRALSIIAIVLGFITPIQHVLFCGTSALQQKYILLCPMLWGIRIP